MSAPDDWIAQVRARYRVYGDLRRDEFKRLLACTEALREMVELRECSPLRNFVPRHEVEREAEMLWERARRALEGRGA